MHFAGSCHTAHLLSRAGLAKIATGCERDRGRRLRHVAEHILQGRSTATQVRSPVDAAGATSAGSRGQPMGGLPSGGSSGASGTATAHGTAETPSPVVALGRPAARHPACRHAGARPSGMCKGSVVGQLDLSARWLWGWGRFKTLSLRGPVSSEPLRLPHKGIKHGGPALAKIWRRKDMCQLQLSPQLEPSRLPSVNDPLSLR